MQHTSLLSAFFSSSLFVSSSLALTASIVQVERALSRTVLTTSNFDAALTSSMPSTTRAFAAVAAHDAPALDAAERLAASVTTTDQLVSGTPMPAGLAPSVRLVAASGSGCAGQRPTIAGVAEDARSFSIEFDGYSAQTGHDESAAQATCTFAIDVEPPTGMTYAVTEVPLNGKAELRDGATGRASVQYFYQAVPENSSSAGEIAPVARDWSTGGVFAADQIQFAPCGARPLLFLTTSLAVHGEEVGARSRVSMNPELNVHLAWAACP